MIFFHDILEQNFNQPDKRFHIKHDKIKLKMILYSIFFYGNLK